jgi:hypothetical protein
MGSAAPQVRAAALDPSLTPATVGAEGGAVVTIDVAPADVTGFDLAVAVDGEAVAATFAPPSSLTFVAPARSEGPATVLVQIGEWEGVLVLTYAAPVAPAEPIEPIEPTPEASAAPVPVTTEEPRAPRSRPSTKPRPDPGPREIPAGARSVEPVAEPLATVPERLAHTGPSTGVSAAGVVLVAAGALMLRVARRRSRPSEDLRA